MQWLCFFSKPELCAKASSSRKPSLIPPCPQLSCGDLLLSVLLGGC